jgi:hypothetical protein
VDVQYSYIVGSIAASGAIGVTVAGYNDDGSGSQIDTMNVINRSDWLNVRIARDDADSGYFFVTFTDFNDLNSDIVRFPAVEGTTTQWSSYQLGILGPVTKYSEASGSFNSLVSISTSVFAYHTGLEDIYKLLNTDLSLVATWSKPGSSFVFKDGSDLWLARADEFAKINQTTGAESLNFTVAGTINDAVAVGGYVYVFIPTLEKVKKYALASGAVQAFEYDYIDSFNAFMAGSPVLAIDGTLLSIGRAYVDQATGEYVGTIVVVDTTTDTIL